MNQIDRYQIKNVFLSEGRLTINWGDGHASEFHAIWLRHQCNCSFCGTPVNAIRGIRLHHIPDDIAISSLDSTADTISIVWNDEAHSSTYQGRWLRDHCYSKSERQQRKHRPILWNNSILAALPTGNFEEAEADPQKRLAILEKVRDYGFCKITHAPTDGSQAHRMIELVGPQRQTHYGTYILSKKKSIDNVGDTTDKLDPHIDETYRLSAIGITVFQVLQHAVEGGFSTLVDGFEAARRFKDTYPDDYDLLTKVPIISQRLDTAHNSQGQQRWFLSRMPVLKLDSDGDLSGVRLNERQISPLDIDGDLVEPTYRALRRIFEFVYDPDLLLTLTLKKGEGLLFDNQRLLHGRTAYTQGVPARSVLTSSVNLEDFHSSMRMLQHKLGIQQTPMMYSQGIAI